MPDGNPRDDCFLQPGEVLASAQPMTVRTVLGSCVAVCLWDAGRGVGGINHYLLPRPTADAEAAHRYGIFAIPALIEQVLACGGVMATVQAAVVGGGRPAGASRRASVGDANRALAMEILAAWGIPVLRDETGGAIGRSVRFHMPSGRLEIRVLPGLLALGAGGE